MKDNDTLPTFSVEAMKVARRRCALAAVTITQLLPTYDDNTERQGMIRFGEIFCYAGSLINDSIGLVENIEKAITQAKTSLDSYGPTDPMAVVYRDRLALLEPLLKI